MSSVRLLTSETTTELLKPLRYLPVAVQDSPMFCSYGVAEHHIHKISSLYVQLFDGQQLLQNTSALRTIPRTRSDSRRYQHAAAINQVDGRGGADLIPLSHLRRAVEEHGKRITPLASRFLDDLLRFTEVHTEHDEPLILQGPVQSINRR